jgi:hypothetical protein
MQTYVFTVAVTGEDVQDIAAALRESVVLEGEHPDADVMVTEAVRVTP